jgi:hypothetical protein
MGLSFPSLRDKFAEIACWLGIEICTIYENCLDSDFRKEYFYAFFVRRIKS